MTRIPRDTVMREDFQCRVFPAPGEAVSGWKARLSASDGSDQLPEDLTVSLQADLLL